MVPIIIDVIDRCILFLLKSLIYPTTTPFEERMFNPQVSGVYYNDYL